MKDLVIYTLATLLFVAVLTLSCGSSIPNPCEANPAGCIDMVIQVAEDVCQQVDPDAGIAECIQDIVEANK